MLTLPVALLASTQWVSVEPPTRCGLAELLSRDLSRCTTLDLEGALVDRYNVSVAAPEWLNVSATLEQQNATNATNATTSANATNSTLRFDEAMENATVRYTTETIFANETVALLADALRGGGTARLSTLLLSWNDELADENSVAMLSSAMAGHPSLRHVEVERSSLTHAGVALLASGAMPTLSSLSLSWNDVGEEGAAAIGAALRGKARGNLTNLHLSHAGLGAAGVALHLAPALGTDGGGGEPCALERLVIDHNNVADEGASALADALRSNSRLATLDLSYNGIAQRGVAAIADALGGGGGGGNGGGDDGDGGGADGGSAASGNMPMAGDSALSDGKAMAGGAGLSSLYLSSNSAGDGGAAAIGRMLRGDSRLRTLCLRDNGIGEEGAGAIESSLEANRRLHRLFLGSNDIDAATAERIQASVLRNSEGLGVGTIGYDGRAAESRRAGTAPSWPWRLDVRDEL